MEAVVVDDHLESDRQEGAVVRCELEHVDIVLRDLDRGAEAEGHALGDSVRRVRGGCGREADAGMEMKKVPLPAVVTVDLRIILSKAVKNGVTAADFTSTPRIIWSFEWATMRSGRDR